MEKKYRKKIEKKILNLKILEFSNAVEQSLEEVLNELITNNYKRHSNNLYNIIRNKTNNGILYKEINELSRKMLYSSKKINISYVKFLCKKDNLHYKNFIDEIMRTIKFTNHLQDISNSIELIKNNIDELYKYPVFKKQTYITEFCLSLSSFFKENIDIFFMRLAEDENIKNKTADDLSKIISLGNKIINEFFINIAYENQGNVKDPANQVIYYSNIISLLELISINSIQFTFI